MSTSVSSTAFAYRIGDEIFRSEPWIFSIGANKLKTHCYHCLGRPDEGKAVRRCTGCLLAGYCSDNCQKLDWKSRHRDECQVLKCLSKQQLEEPIGLSDDDLDRLMVLLKMIGKLKANRVGDEADACKPRSNRTFNDLMSHESEFLRLRPDLLVSYNVLKAYLDMADPADRICSDFLSFVRLWGKFLINNYAIYDLKHPAVVAVGRGIYLQPSILDHSCLPNALQCSIGKTVSIKAIRDILKAEDVRIAYMSPFDLVETRRSYLEKAYFFTCQCSACADQELNEERNSMLCSNQDCFLAIPLNASAGKACRLCGAANDKQFEIAKVAIERLCSAILELRQNKKEEGFSKLPQLEKAIDQGTVRLYPTNFTLGIAHKDAVGLLSAAEGCLNESMENLLKTVVSRRQHIRDYCYQSCFLVLKCLVQQQRDREALTLAKEVADFFRIVAGQNSLLHKTWCDNVSNL